MGDYNYGPYGPPPARRRRTVGPPNQNAQPQQQNQVPVPGAMNVQNIPLPPGNPPAQDPVTALAQQLVQINQTLANQAQSNNIGTVPSLSLPVKFRGRSDPRDFETFLKELYRTAEYYGWDGAKLSRIFPMVIEGEALALYENLPQATQRNWRSLTDALYQKFMHGDVVMANQRYLQKRKQRQNESIAEYASAIKTLVSRAYPAIRGFNDRVRTDMAISTFRNGLKPEIRVHILRKAVPNTLDHAISDALDEEELQREMNEAIAESLQAEQVNALASQLQNFSFPLNQRYQPWGWSRWDIEPADDFEDMA